MAINYSIRESRNPNHPNQSPMYYPQVQIKETVTLSSLAEEMSYGSCLKGEKVVSVVNALAVIMAKHLGNGDNVNLGEFGTFQCQIQGKGATSQEEFDPAINITGVKIQYRPSKYMKDATKEVKFQQVPPLKAYR